MSEPVRSTKGPLTRLSEEEYFRALDHEFAERLKGSDPRTLRRVERCVYDLTNVARSAMPGASLEESPVITSIVACLSTFGLALNRQIENG